LLSRKLTGSDLAAILPQTLRHFIGAAEVAATFGPKTIYSEPIQEVEIHGQAIALVKRRSMILIIARRMKAATVLA